mgnify:CR=1 FL=1|jgi:uncharacterized protein with GYD domain
MANRDLNEKIKQESERLKELQKKREELDQKIKKSESVLERYHLMKNSERYEAIQRATESSGLSIDDILSALKSGDILGLQERMEEAKTKERQETE